MGCACVRERESKTLSSRSYLIAKNNVVVNCFINYLSQGVSSLNKHDRRTVKMGAKEGEEKTLESLINNIFIGQRKLSPLMKCGDPPRIPSGSAPADAWGMGARLPAPPPLALVIRCHFFPSAKATLATSHPREINSKQG